MMRPLFSPCGAVALTRWRCKQDVVCRRLLKVGLLQVLACVHCPRMVDCMPLYSRRPMVCSPQDIASSGLCSRAESTYSREEVDGVHTSPFCSMRRASTQCVAPSHLFP